MEDTHVERGYMELKTYLSIIARRKWIVIGLFIILLLATVAVFRVVPPKYSATTKLRVLTPRTGGTNYVSFDIYYATRLMNTYVSFISSGSLQNEIMKNLKLTDPPDVTATVVADSEVIKITAQARDPNVTASIANMAAEMLMTSSNNSADEEIKAQQAALNQQLIELDKSLSMARSTYKQLTVPYTQNNTIIAGLNLQIDFDQRLYLALKDRYELNQSAKSDPIEQASLNSQLSDLKNQIDQEKAKAADLNAKVAADAVQISAAQADISLKEQQYTTMVTQQNEFNTIRSVQGTNTLVVVDQATPPATPVFPNMLLVYSLGSVISLFLAVLVAFVIDNLDDTVHSSAQVESIAQTDILGKIVTAKSANQMFFLRNEYDYQGDITRLQLNLHRISQARPLKSLLISSTEPHENESMLIANLAREYAKSGERVVLVDANMRTPSVHQLFSRVKNDDGLSQVLMGRAQLDQAIKESGVSNLYILPAGPMLNNPGLFLGSDKMKGLLAQLRSSYDMVLLNVPAILSVADSDELVTFMDGVVLVVERGKTRKHELQAAVKYLANLKASFIGCVVDRAEVDWNVQLYQNQPKAKKITV